MDNAVTPRILIVDSATGRFQSGRVAGWDVVVETDGWQALRLVSEQTFTIVLVDAELRSTLDATSLLVRVAIGRPGVVRWMMGERKPANYHQLLARDEVEGFMRQPFDLAEFLGRLSGRLSQIAEPKSSSSRSSVPRSWLERAFSVLWRRNPLKAPEFNSPRRYVAESTLDAEQGTPNAMPPMPDSPLASIIALARDVAERVRDPLAGARLDLISAQTLLAPPSTVEQTALGIALIGNARAALQRIHAVIAHMVQGLPSATAEGAPEFTASWGNRILVVDDHEAVRGSIGRMLAGHDVVALASAREALERIGAGERFAFILSDLMMSSMTGDKFFEELARLAPEQAERFLFMSGGALSDDAREGMRRAARPVISKPFKPVLLHRLLAGVAGEPPDAARP